MDIFAERLKELRTEKGLSTAALGKAIGVSGSSITHWELKTYEVKAVHIIKLAKFFNVSADYLLGLEN